MAVAVIASAMPAGAQGTLDDYERAYGSRRDFAPDNVYYDDVNAVWLSAKPEFWYVRKTPEGQKYVVVNAATRKEAAVRIH